LICLLCVEDGVLIFLQLINNAGILRDISLKNMKDGDWVCELRLRVEVLELTFVVLGCDYGCSFVRIGIVRWT
jgi:hypothetical protein